MTSSITQEIIDLTSSPGLLESIAIQPGEEIEVKFATIPAPPLVQEREKKATRSRKKRKKSMVEGESQESSANTREHSVEEGEVGDAPSTQSRGKRSSNAIHAGASKREGAKGTRTHPREQSPATKRRSHSPPRRRTSSPQLPDNAADIFFIDIKPVPLPPAAQYSASSGPADENQTAKLLLPAHVSVFGTVPVEILPPVDPDEDDYIEYLDYDDRKDVVRYFEEPVGESVKPNRTVCKNCGAEGEHKTAACPVLICLTCGARDEHSTRSCPISKTCFTCGMRGHINATCPNRRSARFNNSSRYDDCDRCGSLFHKTNECPTLWRLYVYLADSERARTLRTRQEKKNLSLGHGGEGYIADDEWCYNCGSCGHWGDDCNEVPHNADLPQEPSAFSNYNIMSGPFFDPTSENVSSTSRYRAPRDWEQGATLPEGWGNQAPDNVGRQGRRKNMARLEKRAREQEVDDDPDDWFGSAGNTRNRGMAPGPDRRGGTGGKFSSAPPQPPASKKLVFSKSLKDAGQQFQPESSSMPSLLSRLGDSYRHEGRARNNDRPPESRPPRPPRSHHEREYHPHRKREPARERDRDKYRHRDDPGPRYKGGYNR